MTRREFVHAAAVSSAALAASNVASAAPAARPVIVDTHLHCFAGADDPRFPYHERAPYRPAAAAPPELLLKLMDGAGIGFAIVVHPEPYQDDHRYLAHCLAVGRGRLKGTILVFADRPDSVSQLPGLVKRMPVVAARVHAYAPDRLPPFGKPELRRLWQLAGDNGLAMQLHFEPRYAAGFEPLIREFKDTRVIIDHLGRPFQGTPEEHARVVRWGRLPNTVIKLAAIPDHTSYPHRDIRPVIRRLADAYGADRMIYGGGFGSDATAPSYRAAAERVRGLLEFMPAADLDKVLGGTAMKLFRFAEA